MGGMDQSASTGPAGPIRLLPAEARGQGTLRGDLRAGVLLLGLEGRAVSQQGRPTLDSG